MLRLRFQRYKNLGLGLGSRVLRFRFQRYKSLGLGLGSRTLCFRVNFTVWG